MNDPTILHTAHQALHDGPAIPDRVFDALHAEAEASAIRRRRTRLRMRFLRIASAAGIAALLALALLPATRPSAPAASPVENALELLLLDEYGDTFDEGLAASDKLLLFQEYPGYL